MIQYLQLFMIALAALNLVVFVAMIGAKRDVSPVSAACIAACWLLAEIQLYFKL